MTEATVAAVDCGSNSVKLLVTRGEEVLHRESHMVRLGQGVDVTGLLNAEALARAERALDSFAAAITQWGVTRVRCVATSATRDAANAEEFTDIVRRSLGVVPEVLSGDEEAALAFAGALLHVSDAVPSPRLVVDIGGGSTELVVGDTTVTQAVSLDIGAVRLHERHLFDDPPTAEQLARCRADVAAALDGSGIDFGAVRSVVGVAGTIVTLAGGVSGDSPALRTAYPDIAVAAIRELSAELLGMSVAERRELPFMHPGRADVMGAGAVIFTEILARTSVTSVCVAGTGLLDGVAWSMR